jgi:PAS domain S-box-containing protein
MSDSPHEFIDALKLLEAMTESVLVTTNDLDSPGPSIVYVNPAFERMTGWAKDEVIGKSPRILQGIKTDHGVFIDLRKRLEKGASWFGQTTNYRKDGSEFVMEWSIVPIENESGEIHQYLAVQRDVTKRVAMEHDLAAARSKERKWFRQLEKTNQKLSEKNLEQLRTLNLFTKYVPEAVVKKGLAAHGGSLFQGEKLEIVALFCDMRGFTSISEELNPDAVVKMLNTYYEMMAEVVATHGGTVAQFVGDEIFAVFGAPLPIRDCVGSALRCALAMVERLKDINTKVADLIGQDIRVGIGMNFGPVVAGNLGSEERLSYSVIGDTVNTAKRIEALANNARNTILIGESIYTRARHLVRTQDFPAMPLKGKKTDVKIYEVLGLRGDSVVEYDAG